VETSVTTTSTLAEACVIEANIIAKKMLTAGVRYGEFRLILRDGALTLIDVRQTLQVIEGARAS